MLLEFYAGNYRSFKDGFSFSMMPAPKQKGLDYSILNEEIEGKSYKALSSAVIYGANASGKTNIIGAMDTFKNIVLRGNIKNSDSNNSPNIASNLLEIIPNSGLDEIKNTEFGIKFIEKGVLIEYTVEMNLGKFLDRNFNRMIIAEELKVNNISVFARENNNLKLRNFDKISDIFLFSVENIDKNLIKYVEINMGEDELFLVNGFKNMFSSKLASFVTDWIKEKFVVIYRADSMELKRVVNNPKEDTVYIEEKLNEIAKKFGVNSSALGYIADKETNNQVLCSIFKEKNIAIPAEYFESYGTIRFVNIFPIVVQTLMDGATLVVDEFDASIHPKAVASIINAFHDDNINKNKAQLIFNTHNPIFLTPNLFRRDEIKFVERDEEGVSEHYSLSDFKTYGRNGVRKNEDFLSNYMENRYGAINDVDFYGILKELMEGK